MHVTIISTYKCIIKVDNCKGSDEYPGPDAISFLKSPSDIYGPFCGKRMKFLAHSMAAGLFNLLLFRLNRYVYNFLHVHMYVCIYVSLYFALFSYH